MKLIDLTGKKFGKLLVINRDYNFQKEHDYDKPYWYCLCDCGKYKTVSGKSLREGSSTNCGCSHGQFLRYLNFKDITGQHFGKLTAKQYLGNSKWLCQCECGTLTEVKTSHLQSGHTQSCGCQRSRGEDIIRKFLLNNNFIFKTEYTIPELRNSNNNLIRFDFVLFDIKNQPKIFIEFNGKQHYDSNDNWYKETVNEGFRLKKDYCLRNNFSFYEIRFDDNIETVLKNIDFSILNN